MTIIVLLMTYSVCVCGLQSAAQNINHEWKDEMSMNGNIMADRTAPQSVSKAFV